MTLLLTVLGAMLCSLTVSSEVIPQSDFNVQGVGHITVSNMTYSFIDQGVVFNGMHDVC